jgi:hypothetical protein
MDIGPGIECRVGLDGEALMTVREFGLAMVCGLAAASVVAQQPVSAPGTGTVLGHVACGDTQRPARFAHVALYGVPTQFTEHKKVDPSADAATQMAAALDAMTSMGKTNMVQVQTGADGSYVATDVAPGDYYLFAAAAGYIAPMNRIQTMAQAGVDMKKPLLGVTIVHVTAGRSSTGDVVMDRGAAISGTISWDDGSPVSGAMMSVVPAKGEQVDVPQQFNLLALTGILNSLMNISDDQGHFRLSGLPPGDYLVLATIQAGQQSGVGAGMNLAKMMAVKPMLVYAPAAFHTGDAKPVTLRAGEERRDELVTLNLGGLHTVSGHVRSLEDHHGINSGMVTLQDVADKKFVRAASLDTDGGYSVTFVPAGTFDVKIADAEDTEPDTSKKKSDSGIANLFGADTKTIRSYADGKLSVVVSDKDVTDEDADLIVDKAPKGEPDFSKMLGDDDTDKPAAK